MDGGRGGVRGDEGSLSRRRSMSSCDAMGMNKGCENAGFDESRRSSVSRTHSGERSMRRLSLSKAITVSDNTTVLEACYKMAARRVDAVLIIDSNALLCGILTDRDIVTRVIADELKFEEVPVSKVMTRNPDFVLSDTLAVEALQKMVKGKFRHLPVVENGEVIALLDIAKCLYDAIARMERAAEKGQAIAAAVVEIEKHWRTSVLGSNTFIEALRERMVNPVLSTIIQQNSKVVKVLPSDSVLTIAKKMRELKLSSAAVVVEDKLHGILTSRDILMRIIAQNLSPESTPVQQVMTSNPAFATMDTPIVDALHTMLEGKFLHLPIVDRDGNVVSVVDVIHITHAAVATVGSNGGLGADPTNLLMQKLWDSAMSIEPFEDYDDNRSDNSMKFTSEGVNTLRAAASHSSGLSTFAFKLQDRKGRMHRFNCGTTNLSDLMASILQRAGDDFHRENLPLILYEDEDRDKVVIASDNDLQAAVQHARQLGWKGLRLYLEFPGPACNQKIHRGPAGTEYAHNDAWASAYRAAAAGAAFAAGIGFMAYLKRSGA